MIKERADSLKPCTVYLSLGLINIQWRCHGWVAGIIYSQKRIFPQAATTLGGNLVLHGSHLDPPLFTALLSLGVHSHSGTCTSIQYSGIYRSHCDDFTTLLQEIYDNKNI